ncbi:MAG: hypothetical protein ACR2P3_15215 [Geminicoccaceae bacterium]
MHREELRRLVRDAIAQELRPGPSVGQRERARELQEEVVSIGSDAELAGFVRRLLDMVEDLKTREDIRAGRLKFKLAGDATHRPPEVKQMAQPFVTERQVDALPEGTSVVSVAKGTRLTPLAKDRLRARNITIERAAR